MMSSAQEPILSSNSRRGCISSRPGCPVFATVTTHEVKQALKRDYIRKIAIDACLVGTMKTPNWSRISSSMSRYSCISPCTYTTTSGNGGTKTYPYASYAICDCMLNLRRPRRKSLCVKCTGYSPSTTYMLKPVPIFTSSSASQCLVLPPAPRPEPRHRQQQPRYTHRSASNHDSVRTDTSETFDAEVIAFPRRQQRLFAAALIHSYPTPHQLVLPVNKKGHWQQDESQSQDEHAFQQHYYQEAACRSRQRQSLPLPDSRGFETSVALLNEVHIR